MSVMPITFEPVPEWLQDELLELVERQLLRLHIPRGLDGFHYQAAAIVQAVQNPQRTRFITKELYPDLAQEFGSTASNVERAMRTAVRYCWERGGRETLEEMAATHLIERPTNSEFIDLVAAYIRHSS